MASEPSDVSLQATALLVSELNRRVAFIGKQTQLGMSEAVLLADQAQSFQVTVMNTPGVDMDCATAVSEAIMSGPWTQEQRTSMASVLGDRVAKGDVMAGKKAGGKGPARAQQKMHYILNFFTASDWEVFGNSDYSVNAKLERMAQRLWRLGVTCPSESLRKRGLACLFLLCPDNSEIVNATSVTIQSWVVFVRTYVKGLDEKHTWPYTHIETYPLDPSKLPQPVRAFAYEGEEPAMPPPQVILGKLNPLEKQLCARDTHRGLKGPTDALSLLGAGSTALAGRYTGTAGLIQGLLALIGNTQGGNRSSGSESPHVQLLSAAPPAVRKQMGPASSPTFEDITDDPMAASRDAVLPPLRVPLCGPAPVPRVGPAPGQIAPHVRDDHDVQPAGGAPPAPLPPPADAPVAGNALAEVAAAKEPACAIAAASTELTPEQEAEKLRESMALAAEAAGSRHASTPAPRGAAKKRPAASTCQPSSSKKAAKATAASTPAKKAGGPATMDFSGGGRGCDAL
jgi:hypothetical protein